MPKNERDTPTPGEVSYVDCPTCLARTPSQPEGFIRPERITDPARVKTWPYLVTQTDHKHHVDPGGIVAYYDLQQFTVCSLGHHEHKHGDIARTRCGLIVQLGWKCANRAVYGYAAAKAYRKQVEEHFDRIQRIRGIPIDCQRELQGLVPELKRAVQWRDAKRSTALGEEMLRRASSHDPKASEVHHNGTEFRPVDPNHPGEMRMHTVIVTKKISGLGFWVRNLDVQRAERLLGDVADLVQDAKGFDENENEIATALDRRVGSLLASMRGIRDAVEICRQFLATENLRLADMAVNQGQQDQRGRYEHQ